MKLLQDRVAIVTGAARGIGEAIALKLAEHGAHIAFTYVSDSSAERAAALVTRLGELDVNAPTVVFCAGGYRSSIAASALRQRGFTDVSDLIGGFGAWQGAGGEVTQPVGAH